MHKYIRAFVCVAAAFILSLNFAFTIHTQTAPEPVMTKMEEGTIAVWVSVMDPQNRPFSGLKEEHFKIFEDKVEQPIIRFSRQAEPISIGILWDISNSMKSNENILRAKDAITRLLKTLNPEDECFMIAFDKTIRLIQPGVDNSLILQEGELKTNKAGERTAFYDSIFSGIDALRNAKHGRKVLVILSDGEDNTSRHSEKAIRELASASGIHMYAVAMPGAFGYKQLVIQNLASLTGGRVITLQLLSDPNHSIDYIRQELHGQYLLRYAPANAKNNGKWRKIGVKLAPPKGFPKLTVHAREGYYPPKN